MTKRLGWTLLVGALVAAPAARAKTPPAAKAKAAEPTFRFDPPIDRTFVESLRIEAIDLPAKGGKHLTNVAADRELTFRKTPTGFALVDSQTSFAKRVDGRKDAAPPEATMDGMPLTYDLDGSGKLRGIAGYEPLAGALAKVFPNAQANVVESLARDVAEGDRQRRAETWRHRVAQLVGHPVPAAKAWVLDETLELPTPDRDKVTVHGILRASGTEPCDGRQCVRLDFVYDSDAKALPPESGPLEPLPWLRKRPIAPSPSVTVSGAGTRVIDPATMLIWSETEERTMRAPTGTGLEKLVYSLKPR